MRISLRRLAAVWAIGLVTFGLQQAALAQDEVPIVFPEPAPVLEIEPPDVPIVPTPQAPSVTPLEGAAEETEQGAPSEPTGEEAAPEKSAEPAEAAPEPEGPAALDGDGGAAKYQIPVMPSKQAYGASNGSFTYGVDLDLPPFHGIEPKLSLRYSSNVGLRAGGKSQGWLGVGWILDGLDVIERAVAAAGTPRYNPAHDDIFLWNGEPLLSCTDAGVPSATCAGPTPGPSNYFSKIESYAASNIHSNNTWTITRPDGVVFRAGCRSATFSRLRGSRTASVQSIAGYWARLSTLTGTPSLLGYRLRGPAAMRTRDHHLHGHARSVLLGGRPTGCRVLRKRLSTMTP